MSPSSNFGKYVIKKPIEVEGDPRFFKAFMDTEYWQRDVAPRAYDAAVSAAAGVPGFIPDMAVLGARFVNWATGSNFDIGAAEEIPLTSEWWTKKAGANPNSPASIAASFLSPTPADFSALLAKNMDRLGIMAGVGARKLPETKLRDLSRAQELEKAKVHPDKIWQETGWLKDPLDKKWKFHIDDTKAVLSPIGRELQNGGISLDKVSDYTQLKGVVGDISKPNGTGTLTLSSRELMDHKELFDNYPHIADMQITLHLQNKGGRIIVRNPEIRGLGLYTGRLDKSKSNIDVFNTGRKVENTLLGITLHEVQHAVQHIEGFASGGTTNLLSDAFELGIVKKAIDNADSIITDDDLLSFVKEDLASLNDVEAANAFEVIRRTFDDAMNNGGESAFYQLYDQQINNVANVLNALGRQGTSPKEIEKYMNNYKKLNKLGADYYFRLAGEVESRAVQKMLLMTAEEVRAANPLKLGDVPLTKRIVPE